MAAGRRRAETVRSPQERNQLVALGVGSLVGVAAWVFLVAAAIGFGRSARDAGGPGRWLLTVVAALGAALCLLLVLVLVARARDLVAPRRPASSGGVHRSE